jgi:DNA polymerase-3 subunit delta
MKLGYRDIDAQVKKLSPSYLAVLIFGPDEGLVRERAIKIAKQISKDLSDPFLVANLNPDTLKSEPALLTDEVAAISMMGGRRVIRIDGAAENVTKAAAAFLENPIGDGLVVITAGNLKPSSGLRKLFEKAKNAASIACYEDNLMSLQNLISDVMREHNLRIAPDAAQYLQANLGSDRMISRGELAKLALYMHGGSGQVTLGDAQACVGDSGSLNIDMIATATTGGELRKLDTHLFKAFNRGENAIPILRSVARKLNRLHLARGYMDQGVSMDQAMNKLLPRVFAMEIKIFKVHLGKWDTARLASALEIVSAAEVDCKTTNMPAEAVCSRACLRIANVAR